MGWKVSISIPQLIVNEIALPSMIKGPERNFILFVHHWSRRSTGRWGDLLVSPQNISFWGVLGKFGYYLIKSVFYGDADSSTLVEMT